MRRADFITGPGQTMDLEYRPIADGLIILQATHRTESWKTQPPIRVER